MGAGRSRYCRDLTERWETGGSSRITGRPFQNGFTAPTRSLAGRQHRSSGFVERWTRYSTHPGAIRRLRAPRDSRVWQIIPQVATDGSEQRSPSLRTSCPSRFHPFHCFDLPSLPRPLARHQPPSASLHYSPPRSCASLPPTLRYFRRLLPPTHPPQAPR
jgi:hypothetical protein